MGVGGAMFKSCVLSSGQRVSHMLGSVPAELVHLVNLTFPMNTA